MAADLAAKYAAGDHESVAPALRAHLATADAVRGFRAQVDSVLRSIPPAAASAFLLEAAIAAFHADQAASFDLLRLGADRVRDAPRSFELAWHHAAVAWLQGPVPPEAIANSRHNLFGLVSSPVTEVHALRGDDFPWNRFPPIPYDVSRRALLTDALRRFPDDVDLRFALVLYDAMRLNWYLYTRNVVMQVPVRPRTPGQGGSFGVPDLRRPTAELRELIALGSPDQRARAMLYLGYFRYYDDAHDEAIAAWQEASRLSSDARVRYLAWLFQARALWAQPGRLGDAIQALRSAATIVPDAQTAARMLASLLYLLGDTDDAGRIVDQLLSQPASDDPWFDFLRGDYRHWQARLLAVREALR